MSDAGVVYFVSGSADDAPIKIGYASRSAEERIKALQTGSAFKLEVLAEVEGDYPLETKFHKLFSAHRLHGEWFRRTPEIMAAIEVLRATRRVRDGIPNTRRDVSLRQGSSAVRGSGGGKGEPDRGQGMATENAPKATRKGRPLESERHLTTEQTKPWVASGMSRRTWYRRRKEKKPDGE